jgi:dihydrofolate reductase
VKRLSLIVAMTRRGVIGAGGRLPWKLSADLKRFRALTMGHHVILGRRTYESLPGPLPGRTLLVLTRGDLTGGRAAPATVLHSLDEAFAQAATDDEVFIIGGAEIYRLALERVNRLYITWVEADVPGDTYFPEWNRAQWSLAESQALAADERNQFATTYCVYERTPPDGSPHLT